MENNGFLLRLLFEKLFEETNISAVCPFIRVHIIIHIRSAILYNIRTYNIYVRNGLNKCVQNVNARYY